MAIVDWLVLLGTLLFIVIYGTWRTRQNKGLDSYLRGDSDSNWLTIGLSVMATQASAITFISTPGQAYESGIGFVQNYFGLPIALIVVAAVFIPIYYRLKVYTAYEYLEQRFDAKTRALAAFIFLLQRGLAAGITIYAPAIILSSALGWSLTATILFVGILVIIYTVSGGTKAVSITQKWQMSVILGGMVVAFLILINQLPDAVSFKNALQIAGKLDKLNAVDFSLDPNKRYTIWTGLAGGFFLALSYFGTDQSQVQRYLSGKSVKESKIGMMFNAVLKIPMQFFILMVGVMAFVFFMFEPHTVLFDSATLEKAKATEYQYELNRLEEQHQINAAETKKTALDLAEAFNENNEAKINDLSYRLNNLHSQSIEIRDEAKEVVIQAVPTNTAKDSDFVFLTFILNYLPNGIIGLLLAVIISAAMSSTSGELNALGTTTSVDFYKRFFASNKSDQHYLTVSKLLTAFWGIVALCFALVANLLENLIEAVNILGSIFYGTVLGIFLTAFFLKFVRGHAVFIAAAIAQLSVIAMFFYFEKQVAYLWYNVIGCVLVLALSSLFAGLQLAKK